MFALPAHLPEAGTRGGWDLPPHRSFTSPLLIRVERQAAGVGVHATHRCPPKRAGGTGHSEAPVWPRSGVKGAAGGGEVPARQTSAPR